MKQSMSTHYIKEEIDIDWDETDNCYGEASHNDQRECSARVVLEKLPESVLQYYVDKKKAASGSTEQFSERSPTSKNFKKVQQLRQDLRCAHCAFKAKYKSILIGHLSRAHEIGKNTDQDKYDNTRKYTRICEKCDKMQEGLNPKMCERCSGKLLFKCSGCAKLFKTHSLFAYHWFTRCGVKGYFKCTKCDFKSVWRSKVVQHMEIMHKSPNLSQEFKNIEWISLNYNSAVAQANIYKCSKCPKTMENPVKLSLHMKSCGGLGYAKSVEIPDKKSREVHNVDSKLTLSKCSNCGKQFSHIYSLNDHIRHCKKKMEYMVKVADYEDVKDDKTDYPSKSLISADEIYARYLKMMVRYCSICQEDSAMEEKNRGMGIKIPCSKCKTILLFKCIKCLKKSTKYQVIKYHLDTFCNPKEEFKCTKCNYKSYTPNIIKEHYFARHGTGTANHECKQCLRKFRRKCRLSNHLLRCGVEPIFKCEHCPFKSKRKLYLRIHIFDSHMEPVITHRRNKIKMTYQLLTEAASHLTVHCSKCKNERSLRDRLKTCRKCETKLYFQCQTCEKNCSVDDDNACEHVKSYLEMIKFECRRCGRGLKSKTNWRRHERCCVNEVTFKCRFCKFAGKYKSSIIRHEKVRHLNEA